VRDDFESKATAKVAKLIMDCSDGPTINMRDGGLDYPEVASTEQAGRFFVEVIRAFALLDQLAPKFIELVDEYHAERGHVDSHCHLCALRMQVDEYLEGKQ